ncbi:hypothetical protein [Enterococcus casseliflavus]|uniref:hypothetical protein n=1 Tax=Enterococcus casseliflavus TaxID=37734 RepID=UPI00115C5987|nr:hypothetical protein [Enterococcus casseliflavus]
MSNFEYNFIKNEDELRDKINNLDKVANSYLIKIKDLYMEDLFFMSIIDKSIKLIDTFLFALDKRNLTVLATLTRVQMDCAMRSFATTMVSDSGDFCKAILIDSVQVNRLVDTNKHKLTDKNLCESLGNYLNLPVYDLYKKVCGFVHFSSDSFHNIAKMQEEFKITLFISRSNREEDKQAFERLSLELANHFLFFGSVLIEDIFASWLEQKKGYEKI